MVINEYVSAATVNLILLLAMAAASLLFMFIFSRKTKSDNGRLTVRLGAIFLIAVFGYIIHSINSNSITIDGAKISVSASGFSASFKLEDNCKYSATVNADTGYQLSFRTKGTSLYTYHGGHYKTTAKEDVFVLISGASEQAYLYTIGSKALMLGSDIEANNHLQTICTQ